MADKNTEEYGLNPKKSIFVNGDVPFVVRATAEVAAADNNGQKYVLARGVSADAILLSAMMPKGHGAVTAGTDFDLGVYKMDRDEALTVVDKDIFFDGVDMSSARTSAVDLATSQAKSIRELCDIDDGDQNPNYCVVLTANTVGTATVDLTFDLVFAPAN
jgi:hypothetical protein